MKFFDDSLLTPPQNKWKFVFKIWKLKKMITLERTLRENNNNGYGTFNQGKGLRNSNQSYGY